MRAVIGDDRGAARLQPLENLALGVGDVGVAGEKFAVRRGDGGDDGDVRPHQPGQRGQLALMVHAHLEHAEPRRRAASAPGSAARRYGCCSSSPSDAPGPARERSSAANSASLVPVLPTEPVTPIDPSPRCAPATPRPRAFSALVVSATRTCGCAIASLTIAPAAPAAKALSTKQMPVGRLALQRDEQVARPDLARIEGDAGDLEVAMGACRPSPRRSRRRSRAGSCRLLPRHGDVVERQHPVADDLALLVALAGEEDDVARARPRRSRRGSPRAGRPLPRARRAGQDRRAGSPPDPRCADCRR